MRFISNSYLGRELVESDKTLPNSLPEKDKENQGVLREVESGRELEGGREEEFKQREIVDLTNEQFEVIE